MDALRDLVGPEYFKYLQKLLDQIAWNAGSLEGAYEELKYATKALQETDEYRKVQEIRRDIAMIKSQFREAVTKMKGVMEGPSRRIRKNSPLYRTLFLMQSTEEREGAQG